MPRVRVELLTGARGRALLESLPPYDPDQAWTIGTRLREQGHHPDLVAAVLTQSRLRARAVSSLGTRAGSMLFTQAGLEQSTRWVVAQRHAERLVAAGIGSVADLGCGIGVDSLAFAQAGLAVIAVERDPLTADVARANLAGRPRVEVLTADVTAVDVDSLRVPGGGRLEAAYLDPSRRTPDGRRVLDPRRAQPPLNFVVGLSDRLDGVAAKVAPGIAHELVPPGAHAQWVSVDGDVVEAALWFGRLAPPGRRSALVLRLADPVSVAAEFRVDDIELPVLGVGPVAGYLAEPDGAVIRAGLVGAVGAGLNAHLLDPTIAYLACEVAPAPSAGYRGYRVVDSMPFGLKALRGYLRQRQVGRVTIKKRGTAVEPDQLRRQLRLSGPADATLVLTRVDGRQRVLVVEPLS